MYEYIVYKYIYILIYHMCMCHHIHINHYGSYYDKQKVHHMTACELFTKTACADPLILARQVKRMYPASENHRKTHRKTIGKW